MKKLILASSSIHRRKLLKQLKLPFTVAKPNIDESRKKNESINQFVKRLSQEKAMKIALDHKDCIVIGSDEVAVCNNNVLGKPLTIKNAKKQLKLISGQKVVFKTGICVVSIDDKKIFSSVVNYNITMRTLNDRQIENYIKKEDMLKCAGSIRIEGLAIGLIEKTSGSDPTSIIGLPLIKLSNYLEKMGYKVL